MLFNSDFCEFHLLGNLKSFKKTEVKGGKIVKKQLWSSKSAKNHFHVKSEHRFPHCKMAKK